MNPQPRMSRKYTISARRACVEPAQTSGDFIARDNLGRTELISANFRAADFTAK